MAAKKERSATKKTVKKSTRGKAAASSEKKSPRPAAKKRAAAKKSPPKKKAAKKRAPVKKKAPAKKVRKVRAGAKKAEVVKAVSSRAAVPPQPAPPAEPFIDRGEAIPSEYRQDRITAMVRDPNWIFVYWELAGPRKDEIKESYGPEVYKNLQWILRVDNLAAGTHQDIPVLLDSKNWYLNVESNCRYQVELGIITQEHRFVSFLRSNQVETPPGGPSGVTDEKWMVRDKQFQEFLAAYGRRRSAGGSPKGPEIGISSSGLPVKKRKG